MPEPMGGQEAVLATVLAHDRILVVFDLEGIPYDAEYSSELASGMYTDEPMVTLVHDMLQLLLVHYVNEGHLSEFELEVHKLPPPNSEFPATGSIVVSVGIDGHGYNVYVPDDLDVEIPEGRNLRQVVQSYVDFVVLEPFSSVAVMV